MYDVDPAKVLSFDFYEQYEEYKAKYDVVSINESLRENKKTMFASQAMPYFGYHFIKCEHETVGSSETGEDCDLGYTIAYFFREKDIPHKKQLDELQKQYWELLAKCPGRISKFLAIFLCFLWIIPGIVYIVVKTVARSKWKKIMKTQGEDILRQAQELRAQK